jgi:hypothetical protein
MVVLRPVDLRRINGAGDDPANFCAHGDVEFRISGDTLLAPARADQNQGPGVGAQPPAGATLQAKPPAGAAFQGLAGAAGLGASTAKQEQRNSRPRSAARASFAGS